MQALLSEADGDANIWIQVKGVSDHELLRIQLEAKTRVVDLKQQLSLLLGVSADDQHLAWSRQLLKDDERLGELVALMQAEIELYGMLASDLNTQSKTVSARLELLLFVAAGFFDVRVPEERSSPGFLLPKLSFSFPQLPLAQRIFVEDVETGAWAEQAGVRPGDEILALGGRRVSSLVRGEFSALLEQTLCTSGVIQFYRGGLESYFPASFSSNGTSGSVERNSVLCLIASMEDHELMAMRLPTGARIHELKQHLARLLRMPDSSFQLLFQNQPLEDDAGLDGYGQGTRLALLRVALFTQEEFGEALKSELQAELGLAFCDPAFLPTGRIAVAAVDPQKWAAMLEFLGEDDLETPSDGQVVAVLPRNDFNALVSRGPMNFLFHSADVPRALPEPNPASVEDTVPDSDGADGADTETPKLPEKAFTQKPRPKPKATG